MLKRLLHVRSAPEGESIEGVRRNELITGLAFLGRRRQVYRRLVALSGARAGDTVLDIGCGGGYLTRMLADCVCSDGHISGIDPFQNAIAYARKRAPKNASFHVGAAQHLDATDGSLDVVVSTLAFHHINQVDRPAVLEEMWRVLRPGGRLLLADFRPSRAHPVIHPARDHREVLPLSGLAAAARFRIETEGDLPLLRYVAATRPAV